MGTEHASESTTVAKLVQTVLQPYQLDATPERMNATGPDIKVGAAAVTSLALALHETATNAVKYGALSTPAGAVRVTWEVRGDDLHLSWEESGGPELDTSAHAPGFGSFLIKRSVVDQLAGQIDHDWQKSGLKLRIKIPIDRLRL
jgi:two-component sensor histidine kinase